MGVAAKIYCAKCGHPHTVEVNERGEQSERGWSCVSCGASIFVQDKPWLPTAKDERFLRSLRIRVT